MRKNRSSAHNRSNGPASALKTHSPASAPMPRLESHGIIIAGGGARGMSFVQMLERKLDRRVMAVAEVDPRRRARIRSMLADWDLARVRVVASLSEALSAIPRAAADVVFVMTPEWTHLEVFRAAVKAGCHVFLEKPIATTGADAREIARLASTTDKTVNVGFVLRQSSFYRKIKQFVEDGALGQIVMLQMNERLSLSHGAHFYRDWHSRTACTGGFLNEKSSHDLDLMCWLKESQSEPARIMACAGRHFAPHRRTPRACNRCRIPVCPWRNGSERCVFHSQGDINDHYSVAVVFKDGAQGVFNLVAMSPTPGRDLKLFGTDGYLEGRLETGLIRLRRYWKDLDLVDVSAPASDMHGGGDTGIVADFLQRVDRHEHAGVSVRAGLRASLMAFAAEKSAVTGRAVSISLPIGARRERISNLRGKGIRHLAVWTRPTPAGLALTVGNVSGWPVEAVIRCRNLKTVNLRQADSGGLMLRDGRTFRLKMAPHERRELEIGGRRAALDTAMARVVGPAADSAREQAGQWAALCRVIESLDDAGLTAALKEIAPEWAMSTARNVCGRIMQAWRQGDLLTMETLMMEWRWRPVWTMLAYLGSGARRARAAAYRVACGKTDPPATGRNTEWLSDQPWLAGLMPWGYVGGETVDRGEIAIGGTRTPALYYNERYGLKGYRFKLPRGMYRVQLHFAETCHPDAGHRRFDVVIQGEPRLRDFDPGQAAGGSFRALVKTFRAAVQHGPLTIDFHGKGAMLNALAIEPE